MSVKLDKTDILILIVLAFFMLMILIILNADLYKNKIEFERAKYFTIENYNIRIDFYNIYRVSSDQNAQIKEREAIKNCVNTSKDIIKENFTDIYFKDGFTDERQGEKYCRYFYVRSNETRNKKDWSKKELEDYNKLDEFYSDDEITGYKQLTEMRNWYADLYNHKPLNTDNCKNPANATMMMKVMNKIQWIENNFDENIKNPNYIKEQ